MSEYLFVLIMTVYTVVDFALLVATTVQGNAVVFIIIAPITGATLLATITAYRDYFSVK